MRPSYYLHNIRRNSGVSLVEYVLGLAILAIVLVGVGLFFLSQPRQLDPVFQFRAVSLAEALAEQVLAVKYDDSNNLAAQERCGITTGAEACSDSPSAQARANPKLTNFTAVDDFDLWCDNAIAADILVGPDQLNLTRPDLYARYLIKTCVMAKTDDDGNDYKEVVIQIQDQNGADLSFTLHRYNIL